MNNFLKVISIFSLLLISYDEIKGQVGVALGFGFSYSQHADSYVREEFSMIFPYSGLRPIVVEGRVFYSFPTETALYIAHQISPVTTTSPYKYSYSSLGIEQIIPGSTFFVTSAFGKNRSKTSEKLAEGNLWLIGIGFQSELVRLQFSFLTGKQRNEQPFLSERENRATLKILFSLYDPIYK